MKEEPARWRNLDELFEAALARPPAARARFVKEACDDPELLREVESLLAYTDKGDELFESGANPAADALQTGATLGVYRVGACIGAGGMGEVYRATDTRLHRDVAIKLLPPLFAGDREWRSRFEREACVLASLSHPSIATVYGMEESGSKLALVMELIEGETLAQRIARGRLPLSEVLSIAVQILGALECAHEKGIVHRDLKPANIMLTKSGSVKLLDFGLARHAVTASEPITDLEETSLTAQGTIVGTVAYMSPEQAEGKKLDSRSDIFSFGSVLYEMIAGRRAFNGETKLATLSAILKEQPQPVSELTGGVPRDMEKALARCLCKDPAHRYQHTGDVKMALEEIRKESSHETPAARMLTGRILGAALPVIVLALAAGFYLYRNRVTAPVTVLETVPLTAFAGSESQPAFSPDGNQVAFVWNGPQQDNADIYVKQVGTDSLLRLTNDPAEDSSPAWSPDGRFIAFLRPLDGSTTGVFLVPAIGGPERKLAETNWPYSSPGRAYVCCGVSWHPDGKWIAITGKTSGENALSLFLLAIDAGEKRRLTFPPALSLGDSAPAFSPDGRSLAFYRTTTLSMTDLYVLSLTMDLRPAGEPRRLTTSGQLTTGPAWSADGREIVFSSRQRGLWRTPVTGPGTLRQLREQGDNPAISRQGRRLVFRRPSSDINIWRLELQRSRKPGSRTSLVASTQADYNPQYSPDGKRIVFLSSRSGSSELWVSNSDGSGAIQLTSMRAARTGSPRWSPDGQHIVFDCDAEGQYELYVINAGGGRPRRLTSNPADDGVGSYSSDGRWIYFASTRTGTWQIWRMPAEGGEAIQVTRNGGRAAFESPDGTFLYYARAEGETSLWRLHLNSGDESQILGSVYWLSFALVRAGLYFVPKRLPDGTYSIQFLDFERGTVRTLARFDKLLPEALSVSPDERYILYGQADRTDSDLMLIENFR